MNKFRTGTLGLLLAVCFTASCSRLGERSDGAITRDIKTKMSTNPLLKNVSIDVSTHGGVVTLTGQAPDDSASLAAYNIATAEKGVSRVNDQINVPLAPAESDVNASSTPPASTGSTTPESSSDKGTSKIETPRPDSPQPMTVTVPAKTIVTVRTIDRISSRMNRAGEFFSASLDEPIVLDDRVIVPRGANARVKLVYAKSAGHMKGRSELGLKLYSVSFQGKTYDVTTSEVWREGKSRGKQTAERVGGGAVLGALIGAIAGGGRGAAIGAAVGGGAGTGAQVWTHGQQVRIPSETRLEFRLERPLEISYVPHESQGHLNGGQASSY